MEYREGRSGTKKIYRERDNQRLKEREEEEEEETHFFIFQQQIRQQNTISFDLIAWAYRYILLPLSFYFIIMYSYGSTKRIS